MPTLDVPERQVLIDFFADVNGFHWHHRLLLVSLGDGKWICCTPDQSVQRVNLADHRIVILGRNADYPADRVAITYAPDNADFDAPTLARLRAEALALAEVLGVQPAAGGAVAAAGAVVWRVCDSASEHFGEELPAACVGNDQVFVERGDRALAEVDGEWLSAAKEAADEPGLDAFTKRFHAGPGRDPRVLSRTLDSQGRRLLPLEKAFPLFLEHGWKHWPVSGPRTVREFLIRIRSAGFVGFLAYHSDWAKASGVGERSAVCREHKLLLELLRIMVETDQVDITSLAGTELMLRRVFQIELAVERNPRSPDFEGLDAIMEVVTKPSGGVHLPELSKWFSDFQQKEAFTLKRFRLAAEERKELDKRKGKKDKDG